MYQFNNEILFEKKTVLRQAIKLWILWARFCSWVMSYMSFPCGLYSPAMLWVTFLSHRCHFWSVCNGFRSRSSLVTLICHRCHSVSFLTLCFSSLGSHLVVIDSFCFACTWLWYCSVSSYMYLFPVLISHVINTSQISLQVRLYLFRAKDVISYTCRYFVLCVLSSKKMVTLINS